MNATPPTFPTWDGSPATKSLFLLEVDVFKESPFFAGLPDWSRKHPGYEYQNTHIRAQLLAPGRIPEAY